MDPLQQKKHHRGVVKKNRRLKAKGADLDEVVPVAEPFFENSLEDYPRNLHDAS